MRVDIDKVSALNACGERRDGNPRALYIFAQLADRSGSITGEARGELGGPSF